MNSRLRRARCWVIPATLVLSLTQVGSPGVAEAAGPSVPLPSINSVPTSGLPMNGALPDDQAAARALHGNQPAPGPTLPGSSTLTATSLSPSATWDVSAQTGDFSWSYPLRVPPSPGGLQPNLALSYRSSAVDGRTAVTNNQPSWIGDGWDLSPGFVERAYGGCADDKDGATPPARSGDLCWRSDNATASYGGGGGMLIQDGSGKWRTKNDDGSRIERLTGAGNGDNDGEYWKITTVDGTQYLFGSQPSASSTWTVPVFGDDPNEPCHGSTFDNSSCVQAWRWNLDTVIDRHGNLVRYYYDTETNSYGFNGADNAVSYIRGGTLNHIDYGLRSDDAGVQPTARVNFGTTGRCVPGSDCDLGNKPNWPDTPLDSRCVATTCPNQPSPKFWSTKRLSTITTQVRRASGFTDVDRWTLNQEFPDPGDGERAALWLRSITHTGLVGGSVDLPAVTFTGSKLANRVYQIDGIAPLNRFRVTGIVSETGGVLSVNYNPPECVFGSHMPDSPETNVMRCFPVRWSGPGVPDRTDYFNKYTVAKIVQSDRLASSTEQITSYEYLDGAAWHKDTSEFVPDDRKTWNEFRGFGRVRIRAGAADDPGGSPITLTEQRFYRGMDGDPKTGARQITVQDDEGGVRVDSDWLQGNPFEAITYDGDGGPIVSKTITTPVWQGPTATRGAFHAYIVRPGTSMVYTTLAAGGRRITKNVSTYDDRGLRIQVNDLGDTSTAADDQCSRTTYVRNTDKWLLNLHSRVELVSVDCDTTPVFPDDAMSDTRASYDGHDRDAVPTVGDPTRTEVASSRPASGPVYVTTSTAAYDRHGRTTSTTDAAGNIATTAFTPDFGGPTTQTVITSPPTDNVPRGMATTTTLEPAFGLPTKVVDPNGNVAESTYDALGRLTEGWLPNRPRTDNPQGSARFTYAIHNDAPTVVTTTAIGPNGNYISSNTLLDGLLRTRQVQAPAVGGGRLITDIRYDSHGRAYQTTQPYFNSGNVDATLSVGSDVDVPGLTVTQFDGAGRSIASVYRSGTAEKWRTTTSYGGDRVDITPPQGATPTTTIADARGNTTELRQYRGTSPTGAYDATTYRYTPAGRLASVTDAANNTWTNRYDLRGREIHTEDPDQGAADLTYDDRDLLVTSKDSRGVTLVNGYDQLGRRTTLKKDSASGPTLAAWTYDTAAGGKGLAATSTRFVNGNAYTTQVNRYDPMYHPGRTSVIIPAAEGALAGTYQTYYSYGWNGSLSGMAYAAGGGLGAETIVNDYDDLGFLSTSSGTDDLVTATSYTRYGEVQQLQLGDTGKRMWLSAYYDTSTRRLNRQIVDTETATPMQADINYTYDPAGNITSIADTPLNQTADVQCFRMDYLQRITEAWTPNNGCAANPSATALGGPSPYWTSYSYDKTGNRKTETQHAALGDTQRTYNYPAAGGAQPHALSSVTTTPAGRPATTDTFSYDTNGNTTSGTVSGAGEQLTWDPENRIASMTKAGKATSFIYTADGDRLLRKDPTGTTLYLAGQELRLAAGATDPVCTRYYTYGGMTVAIRQGDKLTWQASDRLGTAQISVDTSGTDLKISRRRQAPFGASRGPAPGSWPDDKGFIGGTQDPTGLTHLGARDYDPTLGRFISADPIRDFSAPQQLNGYAYSSNNPVTASDPSGLHEIIDDSHWVDSCQGCDNSFPNPGYQGPASGPSASAPAGYGIPLRPKGIYPPNISSSGLLDEQDDKIRRTNLANQLMMIDHTDDREYYDQFLAAFCIDYPDDGLCHTVEADKIFHGALTACGIIAKGYWAVACDLVNMVTYGLEGDSGKMASSYFSATGGMIFEHIAPAIIALFEWLGESSEAPEKSVCGYADMSTCKEFVGPSTVVSGGQVWSPHGWARRTTVEGGPCVPVTFPKVACVSDIHGNAVRGSDLVTAAAYADKYGLWDNNYHNRRFPTEVRMPTVVGYGPDGQPTNWLEISRGPDGHIVGMPAAPLR